jgi:hypothetical protein
VRAFGLAISAVVAGSVLGWWLLGGFCSIPGLKFSNACGHNAIYWLPLFIPVSIIICWLVLSRAANALHRRSVKQRIPGGDA